MDVAVKRYYIYIVSPTVKLIKSHQATCPRYKRRGTSRNPNRRTPGLVLSTRNLVRVLTHFNVIMSIFHTQIIKQPSHLALTLPGGAGTWAPTSNLFEVACVDLNPLGLENALQLGE